MWCITWSWKVDKFKKIVALPFDDIESDDEWITEKEDDVEIEQAEGEIDIQNVPLYGPTIDLALNALYLDNINFDADEDEHVSSGEDLDEDDDDDGDDDIITGLHIDIWYLNLCFTVFIWTYLFQLLLSYIILRTCLN